MKILILILSAAIGHTALHAQSAVHLSAPVYLPTMASKNGQVTHVMSLQDHLLMAGTSKESFEQNRMTLILTNKEGKTEWVKEYACPPAQALATLKNHSLALLNVSEKLMWLSLINLSNDELIWQIPLPKRHGGSLAAQPNGSLAVLTESAATIYVCMFTDQGKPGREIKLPKALQNNEGQSRIISLSDGTYAVAGGGNVWGLAEDGHILWQLGSKEEQINWRVIKQTKNGEIIVAGTGTPAHAIDAKSNVYIWGIAQNGNRVVWARLFGEAETQDDVIDFVEMDNGELLFLCMEDNKVQLINLDYEHQPQLLYTGENNSNYQPEYLIANPNQSYTLVGNSKEQIVIQIFDKITTGFQQKKPSLYLLAVSVTTNMPNVKNNAVAISQLFRQQTGKRFQHVYTRTLTDENTTKAGELAKAFEALNTEAIKNEDLTIVYFSGKGQPLPDDYLLYARDFNAATLHSTTVRLSQLVKDLDNLPGKKLIILDTSQGGTVQNLSLPKNMSILTSSAIEQNSIEDTERQQSAFAQVLLDALATHKADTNTDGSISLVELYRYIEQAFSILHPKDKNRFKGPSLLHKGVDFIVF